MNHFMIHPRGSASRLHGFLYNITEVHKSMHPTTRVLLSWLAGFVLLSLACGRLEAMEFTTRVEQRKQENATAESVAASDNPWQNIENPDGLPEIVLAYSDENMMNLPAFRTTLSSPIIIDNTGPGPWPANMSMTKEDDYQKLGGPQPGLIRQTSTFQGSYNPDTGELTGRLTHEYHIFGNATDEAVESKTDYFMSCELEATRLPGTTQLQGFTLGGADSETHFFYDDEPIDPIIQSWPVDWTVTGELPAGL